MARQALSGARKETGLLTEHLQALQAEKAELLLQEEGLGSRLQQQEEARGGRLCKA